MLAEPPLNQAEFLKRAFLPDPKITVKIASLEYRSNFGVRRQRDFLGFELGSDIATAVDIDDYSMAQAAARLEIPTPRLA